MFVETNKRYMNYASGVRLCHALWTIGVHRGVQILLSDSLDIWHGQLSCAILIKFYKSCQKFLLCGHF
jgi:hypothetical protein